MSSPQWILPLLLCAAGGLAVVFSVRIPAGLPYDEPAHWDNVLFYAQHIRPPVMGVDHVRYEAQQAPLFYWLAGIIVRVVGAGHGLFAVRLFCAASHVLVVALIWQILRATVPSVLWVPLGGTVFVALNPMLLSMSGSVQNDTLALVLIFAATLVAIQSTTPSWGRAIGVGFLAGLAVMTKLDMVPAAIALVVWLIIRRPWLRGMVAGMVTMLVSGWWIVRDMILYGDPTGQSAVVLTGATFSHAQVGVFYVGRTVATYLVLPTEYLRNSIAAPPLVDLTVIAVVVVMLIGLAWLLLRRWALIDRWAVAGVAGVAASSVGAWLVEVLVAWPVAFRTAYASLPMFALGAGGAVLMAGRRGRLTVLLSLVFVLLGISSWVLGAMSHVAGPGL